MLYNESDPRIKSLNEYLNSLSSEEIEEQNEKQKQEDDEQFKGLKESLEKGLCYYCGYPLFHFSVRKPCLHWLLNPKGFKKRHFPLLYEIKGFHEIQAYLRWVANAKVPLKNINNLREEMNPSKVIEETIKYENLEWSFSCSKNDIEGHQNSHEGNSPHYHFQMKVNNLPMINFNGYHVPFNDKDSFAFAVKDNRFTKIKAGHAHGVGMQEFFDNFSPEEIINNAQGGKIIDEENAAVRFSTIIIADKGTTISGDELADLMEKSRRTKVPMAKLARKIKNVSINTIVYPSPSIPEIAKRNKNRGRGNN
ncbi:hypothetical protein L6261_02425 [Candidatus Parcubacteria bacterium]|nr:hypothetical protein [Candidatus Parcubacteria bacterium]